MSISPLSLSTPTPLFGRLFRLQVQGAPLPFGDPRYSDEQLTRLSANQIFPKSPLPPKLVLPSLLVNLLNQTHLVTESDWIALMKTSLEQTEAKRSEYPLIISTVQTAAGLFRQWADPKNSPKTHPDYVLEVMFDLMNHLYPFLPRTITQTATQALLQSKPIEPLELNA